MTDNEKTGELMPCPFDIETLQRVAENKEFLGRLDEAKLERLSEQGLAHIRAWSDAHVSFHADLTPKGRFIVVAWSILAPQSPPVQSDAELQGAIAWMREKHKAGELPHGATWYLNKIIEAAEQRVSGQTGVDALKAVEEIQNYIDLKDEIDGNPYYRLCDLLKLIKSALTAQKGE